MATKKTDKKEVATVVEIKRADLIAAAKDLNEVLQPEPKLNVNAKSDLLQKEITKAASLLEKTDEIQPGTNDVLKLMGVKFTAIVAEEEETGTKEGKETDDEVAKDEAEEWLAELAAAADDLSGIEGIDGTIEVDKYETTEELVEAIKAYCRALAAGDKFSADTAETLQKLGVLDKKGKIIPQKKQEANADLRAKAKSAVDVAKKAKSIDDLKAIAKDNGVRIPPPFVKDIDKLRGYVVDKLQGIASGEVVPKTKTGGNSKKETKSERGPSAYGTAVDVLCKTPDMSKDDLIKAVTAAGIDYEAGKSAVNTAFSAVRSIVGKLRANKLMK